MLRQLFVVQGVSGWDLLRLPLSYTVLLGLAYALVHVVFRGFCRRRRIQSGAPTAATYRREIPLAALTFLLASLTAMACAHLAWRGVIRVRFGPVSWAEIGRELLLYFLLVDLYFYAVHRFLHTPFMFRHVHTFHHRSSVPGPLTAFSAHPAETLLNSAFLPLYLYFADLHIFTVLFVSLHAPVNNILLHNGHEVFPRWWYSRLVTCWYASPIFHDVHHAEVVHNFGLVTTLWDRVFGTIKPAFAMEVRARHVGWAARLPART